MMTGISNVTTTSTSVTQPNLLLALHPHLPDDFPAAQRDGTRHRSPGWELGLFGCQGHCMDGALEQEGNGKSSFHGDTQVGVLSQKVLAKPPVQNIKFGQTTGRINGAIWTAFHHHSSFHWARSSLGPGHS